MTGYLATIATIGGILGGFLLLRYGQGGGLVTILRLAHVIMAIGICLALFVRGNLYSVAIGMFLFRLGGTLYFRTTESVLQTTIPKEVIGSWYGAIDFILRFVGLIGILLAGGWAFDAIGAYALYSILIVMLLVTMLAWRKNKVSIINKTNEIKV